MNKKKKQQQQTDMLDNNISQQLNEHPYVQWIAENRNQLIIGFFLIITIIFLTSKLIWGYGDKNTVNFIKANNDFSTIAISAKRGLDSNTTEKALQDLQNLMKKHPELHAKYDGLLAQSLINQGDSFQADKYVKSALNRSAKKDIPLYANFAESTVLITKEEYAKALDRSFNLKNKMLKKENAKQFDDTLFAFNLLRIALLEQKIGNPKDELDAWNQWKLYTGLSDQPSEYLISKSVLSRTMRLFEEGQVNLNTYINYRIKELEKNS